MSEQKSFEPLKPGTAVKILNTDFIRAWITEYRGPLGPKGAHIYGVIVQKKPRMYMEVREDQLEVLGAA